MNKLIVLASLLTASLAVSAQTAASGAAPAASAPKHKLLHAPKLRKGATPATNPEASPDKKGGA